MSDIFDLNYDPLSGVVKPAKDYEDDEVDYSALEQAYDTTWGRSSTPHVHTQSVKFRVENPEVLTVSFVTTLRFTSGQNMKSLTDQYEEESKRIIAVNVDEVKARYKEISGKAITLTEEDTVDEIEYISFNPYGPQRTAYYKRKTLYSIS